MLEENAGLSIVKDDAIGYKRYLRVWQRTVRFPNQDVEWDIVGHDTPNPAFCVIFPYFTRTRTTTLILEYMQGINGVRYTFPAGGFDPRKHATREDTARDELSEEARLKGGKLVSLLPEGSEGIMEVKWCRNKFLPFVVVDPVLDVNPRERDAEDDHDSVRCNYKGTRSHHAERELALPSVQTAYMGIAWLKDQNLL
ncbi:hypothetical protein BC829DRAFT_364910 [Chytridium lagenaria]|nr:hypothetical protein BC829DRAFT_364910 [Chytridium lagenaria]